MALEGSLTYTTVIAHPTETETHTKTYPNGETAEFETPVLNYVTETYDYAYVFVKQIEVFTFSENGKKVVHVGYHYAGYTSKEAKDNDIEDFLFFGTSQLTPFDYNLNLWSQCYNQLKERENFNELTNC